MCAITKPNNTMPLRAITTLRPMVDPKNETALVIRRSSAFAVEMRY